MKTLLIILAITIIAIFILMIRYKDENDSQVKYFDNMFKRQLGRKQ